MAKSRSGDGKWRYVLFDLDLSFIIEKSGANAQLGTLNVNKRPFNPIIYNLFKNDEFTEYFYERLDMHMKSTISPEAVTARIDAIYNEIEKDMQYEIARWKDATDNSGVIPIESPTVAIAEVTSYATSRKPNGSMAQISAVATRTASR